MKEQTNRIPERVKIGSSLMVQLHSYDYSETLTKVYFNTVTASLGVRAQLSTWRLCKLTDQKNNSSEPGHADNYIRIQEYAQEMK